MSAPHTGSLHMQIPYGAVAELIVIEQGFTFNANHPFHLHGYSFRVVGMNRVCLNDQEGHKNKATKTFVGDEQAQHHWGKGRATHDRHCTEEPCS